MRALLLAAAILALPDTAWPCDPYDPGGWTLDPLLVGVDLEPPAPLRLRSLQVFRAVQAVFDGGPGDSCNEWRGRRDAEVLLQLEPPVDDHADPPEVGLRIELVGSHLPPGYVAGESWDERYGSGPIRLAWGERDDDDLLDFTVRITPLDGAGNEGPTLGVHVRHEGLGCSAAGGGAGLLPLLVTLRALRSRRG